MTALTCKRRSPAQASWHNLGCYGDSRRGMYRVPTNSSIVVHRILSVSALHYTWQLVSRARTHDIVTCLSMAMRGMTGTSPQLRKSQGFCRRCAAGNGKRNVAFECKDASATKQRTAAVRASCEKHGLIPPRSSTSSGTGLAAGALG